MAGRKEVLLWLALIFSLFSIIINGIDMSFNVYAIALKKSFNFTQIQVEIVASMGTLGMGLSFLETIITSIFGYKTTFVVTWIGMVLSCGLFSMAATYNHFFHQNPVSVFFFQLGLSTSNCMASVAVFRVIVETFPRDHSGKIIGLFYAFTCLAKIVFGGLLKLFFSRNLAGFFLTLGVASAVICGLSYILLYQNIPEKDEEYMYIDAQDSNSNQVGTEKCCNPTGQRESGSTPKNLFFSSFFHRTFWPSVMLHACAFTCLNNITTIADSIESEHPLTTVYVISVVIVGIRLIVGFIFDKFMSMTCGFVLMLISSSSFAAAMVLGILWLNIYTLYVITVLVGIAMGAGMTISVSTLILHFGRHQFSVICTMFLLFMAFTQLILQVLIGYLYDYEIRELGSSDTFCKGQACFFDSFLTMLIISSVIIITQFVNFIITVYIPSRVSRPIETNNSFEEDQYKK